MPRQRSRSPLSPILATESATVRLFFILSVLLCSVNKAGLKTETWLLYCLRLRSRSPHNAKHSTSYWGERERAPTLFMSMEIVYVRTYVRPRSTATLYMCERCSNSADLAGFRNQQLFVSCPGNVSTRGKVIDINRSPKIEIHVPRLRKRQHSAPGSLSQLSPREAERLRDGYDSTPDPAYSCLRCSAQRQTATWLLYRVLYSLLAGCSVCYFAHARPTMPSISLVCVHTLHAGICPRWSAVVARPPLLILRPPLACSRPLPYFQA